MKSRNLLNGKNYILITILIFIVVILSSCGAKRESPSSQSAEYALNEAAVEMDVADDIPMENEVEQISPNVASSTVKTKSGTNVEETSESTKTTDASRKLIRNVNLSAETREFDALLETLLKQVRTLQGYVQSSEINGNDYGNNSARYASYVIRIPAEKLDEFLTSVKSSANITHESESTEDVTLQYVDTQSRIQALKTEQESLLKMLEAAGKLNDIIKIQSRLTEVRYEIESYESQLRTYDNLVSYSTVYLDIEEVDRETVVIEDTFWDSIQNRFFNSLFRIKEGSKNFIIWFIGSLPFLIIWAIVLGLTILLIKKMKNRHERHKMGKKLKKKKELEPVKAEEDTPKREEKQDIIVDDKNH